MQKTNLLKHIASISVVTIFIILAYGSGDNKKADDSKSDSAITVTTPTSNWIYDEDTDKMTSKVVYKAIVKANEGLKMKFPYEGAIAYLGIKNRGAGDEDIFLQVTKGQILAASNVSEDGSIMVRFDSDKAESWKVVGPSDGSSEIVYINDEKKFIQRLKTAKKVLIGAEFFDNGTQQIEFNTDGLVWNH